MRESEFKSDKVMPAWLPGYYQLPKALKPDAFSRVRGQSRGVVVSQWTRTMPHWSHALISCGFISIAVHTADMYSRSNMRTLPSARIEVHAAQTQHTISCFLRDAEISGRHFRLHKSHACLYKSRMEQSETRRSRLTSGWLCGCVSAYANASVYSGIWQ